MHRELRADPQGYDYYDYIYIYMDTGRNPPRPRDLQNTKTWKINKNRFAKLDVEVVLLLQDVSHGSPGSEFGCTPARRPAGMYFDDFFEKGTQKRVLKHCKLQVKPTLWCSSSIDCRATRESSSIVNYKSNNHFGVLSVSMAEPHRKAQVL